MKSNRRIIYGIIVLVLLVYVLLLVAPKFFYPYGHNPCTLNCMEIALRDYADDHDGFYPDSAHGSYRALQKLYPKYADSRLLAGVTGDQKIAKLILESGKNLDNKSTSWIYVPGLHIEDNRNIAILWEERKGILPNGKRAFKPVRAVLFNYPLYIKLIPDSEWDKFLLEQESLREKALRNRIEIRRD